MSLAIRHIIVKLKLAITAKTINTERRSIQHTPPLVEEPADTDSSLPPLTLDAEFADFALTVDNKLSPANRHQ